MAQQSVQVQQKQAGTLVDIFGNAVSKYGTAPAMRHKRDGRWTDISYEQYGEMVEAAANGLLSLGIGPGDRVAIFSKNNPWWAITDWATLAIGGATVPIYDTLAPEKVAYILRDSGAKAVMVENADALNQVRSVRAQLPKLANTVVFAEVFDKALEPGEIGFHALLEAGHAHGKQHPGALAETRADVAPDDLASIVYTSGTTGDPKGAMLTHRNLASNVLDSETSIHIGPGEIMLSFLPLSHVFERTGGHFRAVHSGVTVAYAEGLEMLAANMAEVRPHIMLSVPRLYEKLYARIQDKVRNDSFIKRKIFNWAIGVGKRRVHEKYTLKIANPSTEKKYKRAEKLVFSKIAKRTGGRLKFFVSGGAPLSPEIEEFFHAVGLPILQGYGLTETSPVLAVNSFENLRLGSVGKPVASAQIKIASDGEILAKGPMVFQGYYNKPDATKECFDADGYFLTGDIGRLDDDGFLFITDRKKELIVMSNGKNVAPQPIENMLKTKRGVGQAVIIGDKRNFISAVLAPDAEALVALAGELGASGEDVAALVKDPLIVDHFEKAVADVNQHLSRYEQIRAFRLADHEFTQETGELTPTMKVMRRVIDEGFRNQIESMYAQSMPA